MRRENTGDRRQETEDRRQKTEDRRQKTEDRIQKTEYRMSNGEGRLPRPPTRPGGLAMTSLNRFLHSLRSVEMTRDYSAIPKLRLRLPPVAMTCGVGVRDGKTRGGRPCHIGWPCQVEHGQAPSAPCIEPPAQVRGLTKFSGGKNRTLRDYGLSQGSGPYGLDGEDC